MEKKLHLEILPQPDETTCGPTWFADPSLDGDFRHENLRNVHSALCDCLTRG